MTISPKIKNFIDQASWIRRMFEEGDELKQKYGRDKVYDFSLGNPNIEPPVIFQETLQKVVGLEVPHKHAYMPNAGYQETREAVASYLSKKQGLDLTGDHIIMTCGAGGALNVIFKTLLAEGDEVIVPTPYFVEYRFYIDNAGGIIKLVKTKDDFSLSLDAIREAVTEKTKALLINTPNNPTGRVYSRDSLRELATLLREEGAIRKRIIYLISDEPYSEIVYDGLSVAPIFKFYENSIIVSSYSKSLSIPGERIGYIALHPEMPERRTVFDGAVLCNRILGFVNAPALMQRVIAEIPFACVDIEAYRRKRDLLCEGLGTIGYRFAKPEGAFYLFVKSPWNDDVAFVRELLKEHIIAVPGSGFGGPGYFRLAYCVEDETIIKAMDGFTRAFKKAGQ